MTEPELNEEHQNILTVLQKTPDLRLREIHNALVELENSKFQHSPDFGNGWNDERREVRSLRDDLANRGLVTNDYQQWSLTSEGRKQLQA